MKTPKHQSLNWEQELITETVCFLSAFSRYLPNEDLLSLLLITSI